MAQRYENDEQRMRSFRNDRDDHRSPQGGYRGRTREQSVQGASVGEGYQDDYDGGRSRRGSASRWSEDDDYSGNDWTEGSQMGSPQGHFNEHDYGDRGVGYRRSGGVASQGYGGDGGQQPGYGSGYGGGYSSRHGGGFGPGQYGGQDQGRDDQGQGRGMGHDHHYNSWRERQMKTYDDEFKAFNEERQKKFDSEFEEWRKQRASGGSAQTGATSASGSNAGGRAGEPGSRDDNSVSSKKS